jgi:hypothetical protein
VGRVDSIIVGVLSLSLADLLDRLWAQCAGSSSAGNFLERALDTCNGTPIARCEFRTFDLPDSARVTRACYEFTPWGRLSRHDLMCASIMPFGSAAKSPAGVLQLGRKSCVESRSKSKMRGCMERRQARQMTTDSRRMAPLLLSRPLPA